MAEFAPGIADKSVYGDVASELHPGDVTDFVLQHHDTVRRPGRPHYDLRLGTKDTNLFSWAIPKAQMPGPGESRLAPQTQLHTYQYGSFQGRIPHGYGAGNVTMADKGKAIINKVTPNTVQFTLGHKKVPVRYTLVNTNPAKRQWLLVGAPRPGSVPGVGTKPVIKQIRAVDQDDAIEKAVEVQQKIDGASGVVNVGKGGDVEVYSANTSVSGEPIRHTERMGLFGTKVPGRYAGRSLRGELFFRDKKGRAIPFKDVSALLNALPANSIERQRASGYRPQIAVFDSINGDAKTRQELLDLLPKAVFTTPKSARTPEEKAELISRIREGKDPDTSEGVILVMPDGAKIKVKNKEEATGYLTGTFPGTGKRKLAGGLTFKTPEGDEGRVGTGFTDAELADIVARIEELKGKQMRIEHLGRFGSGKLRAPSFRGFETDKVAEGQPQEKLRDATQDLDVDAGTEAFVRNGVKLAYEQGFGATMSKLAGSRWRSDEKLPLVATYPTRGAAGGLNGYRHRLLHDARVKLNRVNKLEPGYPDPKIRFPGFQRLMDAQRWTSDAINPETAGQHLLTQNPKSVNEIKYLYRGHRRINPTAITPMSNGRIYATPVPELASVYGALDGGHGDAGYTLRSTYKASPNNMYANTIDLKRRHLNKLNKLRSGPRALKAAHRSNAFQTLYETNIRPDNEYIGTRISRLASRGNLPGASAPITPRIAKAWASLTGQPQPTASQISQMTPALNTAKAIRNTGAAAGKSFGEVTGIRPMYHAIRALPGQLRSGLPMYWQQAQDVGAKAIPATGAALAAAKGSLLAPAGAAIAASPVAIGAAAAGAGAAGYGIGTVIDRTMGPTVNGEKQRLSEWYADRLGPWYARRRGWAK